MPIITPTVYTPIHDEETLINEEHQTFNEEVFKKMGLNNNWLIDLKPIGSIIFVNINQPGALIPDNSIWQECDGGEIVNPDSPLRSIGVLTNNVPNFQDRYVKVSSDLVTNDQGGTNTHLLEHNHATGGPSSIGGGIQDKGDRRYRVSHSHAVAVQYSDSGTEVTSPAFYKCIAYMKIV